METKTISVETINQVLLYLDTRPHGEVRNIIDKLVQEANEQPEEKKGK